MKFVKKCSNRETRSKIEAAVGTLSHVVGAPFGVVDEYHHESMKEARKQAVEFMNQAETRGRRFFPEANITYEVLSGSPAQSIVEDAQKWGADLYAVGSHGRGFWKRAMLEHGFDRCCEPRAVFGFDREKADVILSFINSAKLRQRT